MNLGKDASSRLLNRIFSSAMLIVGLMSVGANVQAQESTSVRTQDTSEDEVGGNELEHATGLAVHGFANMGYASDTSGDVHRRYSRGFYLNNFDIYFNPDLGNRVRFLSEVVFEPDSQNQQPSFDAERLQAGYVVSKNLTVWAGRFHTPIGYYVIAYHHGAILQTAVEKPRFLDFEDHFGVLPVHTNGLWLNGNFTVGEQRFALMGWLGNADRIVTDGAGFTSLDFDMGRNDNSNLSVGTRFNWIAGGSLDGFQAGVTVLEETIDTMGAGGDTYGTNADGSFTGGSHDSTAMPNLPDKGNFTSRFVLYGVHAVYEAHNIEFLNEFFGFHNTTMTDADQPSYNSYAGYSQLAYWINGTTAPYIRYERASLNTSDPFFVAQYNGLPYTKEAAGLRHNLTDNAAAKVEVSNVDFGSSTITNAGQSYKEVKFDYSIRF